MSRPKPGANAVPHQALALAWDSLPDALILLDRQRRVRYVNPAAESLLRITNNGDSGARGPCRLVLACGPPGEPGAMCGQCWGAAALRHATATPYFETAVGRGELRAWVTGMCLPLAGDSPMAMLLLQPRAEVSAHQPGRGAGALTAAIPPGGAVLDALVRAVQELLGADYAALGRVDMTAGEVGWLAQAGARARETARLRVKVGQGVRGRVVGSGRPLRICSFPQEAPDPPERHPTMRSEGLQAALAVPVRVRGCPEGVLMVAARHPWEYSPAQERLLYMLAEVAGEVLAESDRVVDELAAAIREERAWLAAELHDGIAQLLSVLTQKLWLVRRQLAAVPGAPGEHAPLQELIELSQQAHRDLRLALDGLRSTANGGDFLPALQAYLQSFAQRSHLAVELTEIPEVRSPLAAPVSLQVLRVIQEALTNAVKHSGCRRVAVSWSCSAAGHVFRIADDGCGFAPEQAPRGLGLSIMGDRARSIGGTLKVISAPHGGCTVILTVPLLGGEGETSAAPSGVAS